MGHKDYVLQADRRSVLTLAPGWQLQRTRNDSMHCVNLGVCWYLIGNLLWFLAKNNVHRFLTTVAEDGALGCDAAVVDILHDCYLRFKAWLSKHGLACTVPRFTIKNIHRENSNDVIHFKCKASKSPILVSWLAEITMEVMNKCPDPMKKEAELASTCAWAMAQYFHTLRTAGRWFDDRELEQINDAGHTFLHIYSELARQATSPGEWHIVPKFHQFHHLILDSMEDRNNPRFFHCFGDEDMVGQMLTLARAGHATTVVDNALDNYTAGLKQRLADMHM